MKIPSSQGVAHEVAHARDRRRDGKMDAGEGRAPSSRSTVKHACEGRAGSPVDVPRTTVHSEEGTAAPRPDAVLLQDLHRSPEDLLAVTASGLPSAPRGSTISVLIDSLPGSVSVTDSI